MALILVVSFSNLDSDPRVDRQISALRKRHEIVAAGFAPPRHDVDEFIDLSTPARTKRGRALGLMRLLARRYEDVYWKHPTNRAVLDRLSHVEADAVLANDLSALPIALRLGPPVVFDAHEHAPSQAAEGFLWRLVIAPYTAWQCRHYIPKVAAMTAVGPAIADAYEADTGVPATVVTNAPPYHALDPTDVHEPIQILHHGGAQRGRGLDGMLHLANLLDDRFAVDFVLTETHAGYRDELIRKARKNRRVRFPDPWPMHEIVPMANSYDIGLYLLPPVNFNRSYALPNKLFEYIQARLAVAIGPSPEMARVVRGYGCGIVADDFTPETLADALNALQPGEIAAFKAASHVAAAELCAEENENVILGAIERALVRDR
jgi:hypothetical protein